MTERERAPDGRSRFAASPTVCVRASPDQGNNSNNNNNNSNNNNNNNSSNNNNR